MVDPTSPPRIVVRDVDWSQCHVQLTAYAFAGGRVERTQQYVHRAIERMHNAPSRPFVGAYLLEACRHLP